MSSISSTPNKHYVSLYDSSHQGTAYPKQSMRRLNLEFNAKLKKRLRDNKLAVQYLINRGLTLDTIDHFGLGLSTAYYSKKSGREHADALIYPLLNWDGRFYNKYGYYNIPGVTINPVHEVSWMSGSVQTYYADAIEGRKCIFICGGARDLWLHWQSIQHSTHARYLMLISSTHSSLFPAEWKDPSFWDRWETVFLGHNNDEAGEEIAAKVAGLIGRESHRVMVPRWYGQDWTDFWRSGGDLIEFTHLLRDAPLASLRIATDATEGHEPGRFAYKPININGAFHNGFLYYTAQTLTCGVETIYKKTGEKVVQPVEHLDTVVIRSDRTVHSTLWSAAPKGTKEKDRVLRLTDGTLLDSEPQANRYGTWQWNSIQVYLEGKSRTRTLGEILREIKAYLKNSVWLPNEEDYAILTLTVPVTFAQSIFDSVPLIFLNGPAGSGKSEMGRAMARVCANAYVCGQSSAASIARFINESRGFVVIDDLELIGNKSMRISS